MISFLIVRVMDSRQWAFGIPRLVSPWRFRFFSFHSNTKVSIARIMEIDILVNSSHPLNNCKKDCTFLVFFLIPWIFDLPTFVRV